MRFLFTMLDNPPGFLERKSTAKLLYFKDDIAGIRPSGGARRDRTDDLMLAKHALSQLSYGPKANAKRLPGVRQAIREANGREHQPQLAATSSTNMVGLGGLEPPTSRLSSARSNQLSYKPELLGAHMRHIESIFDQRTSRQAGSSLKWKKERRRRREVPLMMPVRLTGVI